VLLRARETISKKKKTQRINLTPAEPIEFGATL